MRTLRRKNNNKNFETFESIKECNKKKMEFIGEAKLIKQEKDALNEKITALKRDRDEYAKLGFKGKQWSKKKLLEMIEQEETNFRNTKKTATEEKSMMEVIKKMKNSLK